MPRVRRATAKAAAPKKTRQFCPKSKPESYCETERRVTRAVVYHRKHPDETVSSIADIFDVLVKRLRGRIKGIPSKIISGGKNKKLSEGQELDICHLPVSGPSGGPWYPLPPSSNHSSCKPHSLRSCWRCWWRGNSQGWGALGSTFS